MKKTILTALGIGVVAFLYGWFFSSETIPFPQIEIEHLHPMVVHFPIALFISALGLEVLSLITGKESLHKSAVHIYILAALIAPLVVRTGFLEEGRVRVHHPLLEQHESFALWTMWVSVMSLPVLWFVQKEFPKYFRIVLLVFLIAAAALVSLTGDKGGHMVFEYGVGIEN